MKIGQFQTNRYSTRGTNKKAKFNFYGKWTWWFESINVKWKYGFIWTFKINIFSKFQWQFNNQNSYNFKFNFITTSKIDDQFQPDTTNYPDTTDIEINFEF